MVRNDGSVDLTYDSGKHGSTFTIRAYFALVSFNVTLPNGILPNGILPNGILPNGILPNGIKHNNTQIKNTCKYEDLYVSRKNVQLLDLQLVII